MTDQNIQIQNNITEAIKKIISFMDLEATFQFKEELEGDKKSVVISMFLSDDAKFLIGKDGQNLKALEHLVRIIALKTEQGGPNIILDINDYRKFRASTLVDVARQVVARVRNTQKAEVLAPMSAYERRIVHMELAAYPDIATESIGDGPHRRVVIKPYP